MDKQKQYIEAFYRRMRRNMGEVGEKDIEAIKTTEEATLAFIDNPCVEAAHRVYNAYFDIYKIFESENDNPFLQLVELMRYFEETVSIMTSNQRDHFVHSVNVFVMGFCVYEKNERFRKAFADVNRELPDSVFGDWCAESSFFVRWGTASLFYDVGYPVQIISNTLKSYLDLIAGSAATGKKVKVELAFEDFESLNALDEIVPMPEFARSFTEHFPDHVYINITKPTDLMAHRIHETLGLDIRAAAKDIPDYIRRGGKICMVDHGVYSSLVVLKWYATAIQKLGADGYSLFFPVLDSATAILLHNYYSVYGLQGAPFNLGPMSAYRNPTAYLLILCDSLQEWNRASYGVSNQTKVYPSDASLDLDDGLCLLLRAENGELSEAYLGDVEKEVRGKVDVDEMFDSFRLLAES